MPRLYCDASPKTIAYLLDGGGCDYQELPQEIPIMQAEYLAVVYGLSEYFNKWQKELDARHDNQEAGEWFKAESHVMAETPRPLPPPVLVLSDNEVVVKQLRREYHIANSELRKLAKQVWDMSKNVDVHFEWISRKENLAGKMLK